MSEHELHVAAVPDTPDGAADDGQDRREVRLERELARLRGREVAWREERARLLEALEAAEAELAELPALREELAHTRDAAYWLAVTRSSWSWRLGAPARRVAGLLRRRPPSP